MPTQPESVGEYAVVRTLGRGGMGVVYEVRDPQLPRTLALKQILGASAGSNAVERFRREATMLAKIQHPNVVTIHKVGDSQVGPFLVQELVRGRPLNALLEAGPLEPTEAARIVRDLAGGLAAVHAVGILHRDLKPDNVILSEQGVPVLLDFGVARDASAETLTQTGQAIGTPALMAPEQAEGERPTELDVRVDVYGLGALLYMLLTGQKPFSGATAYNVILKVLTSEPVWPRALRPQVPEALDRICRVAMAKQPADRQASAAALGEELERFLDGTPERAGGGGALALLVLSGGMLAVVLGLGLWLGGRTGATPASPLPQAAEAEAHWFERLPPEQRPARLPSGLSLGSVAGEYINAADRSVLVWVPAGSYPVGTLGRRVITSQPSGSSSRKASSSASTR